MPGHVINNTLMAAQTTKGALSPKINRDTVKGATIRIGIYFLNVSSHVNALILCGYFPFLCLLLVILLVFWPNCVHLRSRESEASFKAGYLRFPLPEHVFYSCFLKDYSLIILYVIPCGSS